MPNATIRCSFHKLDKVRCDAYLGWLFLRRLRVSRVHSMSMPDIELALVLEVEGVAYLIVNLTWVHRNFETHLKDFGLDNCDVVIGTFILKANLIANASFSEVEAATNSNVELQ
nr:hypothetical protein CFP56_17801 [Quercus suber]